MTVFESMTPVASNVSARNEPLPSVRLELDASASLNLPAGQVVQLVGEGQKGNFLFDLGGRQVLLHVPAGARKSMVPGATFRVLPGSVDTKLLLEPLATAMPPEVASPADGLDLGRAAKPVPLPGEPAYASLRKLLSPDGLFQISTLGSCLPMLAPFLKTLIDTRRLTPTALRSAIEASGVFFEKKLARGRLVQRGDLKLLLTQLLGSGDIKDGELREEIASALNELEHAQLQVLAAQASGGDFVSLVMPTKNDAPIALSLFRAARSAEQTAPPFVIDVYLKSTDTGNIWCRTVCEEKGELSVFLCASSSEVVKAAGRFASSLERDLSGFGLKLTRFSVQAGGGLASAAADVHAGSINVQI